MTQRFDLRRLSPGPALGDPVTVEQTEEALAFIRAYQGPLRFMARMQEWLDARGTISRRQVAAVLDIKSRVGRT